MNPSNTNERPWFAKAMALGNDFVLWSGYPLEKAQVLSKNLANRRYGVGCDQIIFFEPQAAGVARVWFHNADGSSAEACGNGTRCLAKWLIQNGYENTDGSVTLHTPGGVIQGSLTSNGLVCLRYTLPRDGGLLMVPEIAGPCRAVYVGNPHLVCWTDRLEEMELQGPILENHPHFELRTNVEFARMQSDGDIELRVWERGTGLTPACGSGALGTAYAAYLSGFVGRDVRVHQQGGVLDVKFDGEAAYLIGDAHIVFEGYGNPDYACWSFNNRV